MGNAGGGTLGTEHSNLRHPGTLRNTPNTHPRPPHTWHIHHDLHIISDQETPDHFTIQIQETIIRYPINEIDTPMKALRHDRQPRPPATVNPITLPHVVNNSEGWQQTKPHAAAGEWIIVVCGRSTPPASGSPGNDSTPQHPRSPGPPPCNPHTIRPVDTHQ